MRRFCSVKIITALLFLLLFACPAFAEYGWMIPLNLVKDSIIHSVAPCVAVLAIVGAGISYLYGDGNFNNFVRQCCMLALVISLLVCAQQIMNVIQTGSTKGDGNSGMTSYKGVQSSGK